MKISQKIIDLEPAYLKHTDYHLFPGGRKRLRVIVQICEAKSKELGRKLKVIDVGCGHGSNSFPVASLGHEVLGIDVSKEAIDFAISKNSYRNVRFIIHNLCEKSLEERFDFAICSEVLEHLYDPLSLLKEIAEILEPGGILLITVPNVYGPREVLGRIEQRFRKYRLIEPVMNTLRLLGRMCSSCEKVKLHSSSLDLDHLQKFTQIQMMKLCYSAGFKIKDWINSFWLLNLFGKAKKGTNVAARFDSWIANILPPVFSSGWYVICQKK